MDGSTVNPPPNYSINPNPPYLKGLKILLIALAFIAYSLVLFYLGSHYKLPTTMQPKNPEKVITQEESPISINLLRNPVVYQWSGSVEGTLTAKTENSLTLSNKGASLTIPVTTHRERNIFFGPYKEGTRSALTIDQLELGTNLVGQFWVLLTKEDKDKIDGIFFSVKER